MIEPGQSCPTCLQRLPFPPKPSSPPTKKSGYWLPADEKPGHDSVLKTTAQFLGVHEQPFWEFKTVTMGCGLVLQDESLRGFGDRRSVLNEL